MKVYNPKRAEYGDLLARSKGCFFCDPSVLRDQICTIFTFKYWNVLVNKYPYLDGNVMLVSKRHVVALEQLTRKEWEEFTTTLLEVKRVSGEVFGSDSFNVGINIGPDSGASVEHLHWQVIPRPRKKNLTVVGMLADIHVISMSADDLKRKLSKKDPA